MTASVPQYQDLLGARIDRVGEHDTAVVLQALSGILSQDNDQQARFAAPDLLRLPPLLHALDLTADPGQAILTVTRPDGSSCPATVTAEPARMGQAMPPYPDGWIELPDTLARPRPLYLRHRELPYWFDYLTAEDLLYFQFNSVVDHAAEPFEKFCARLFGFIAARRPARLVIDLRWNGGGDTFLGQPLLHHLIGCPAINRAGALYVRPSPSSCPPANCRSTSVTCTSKPDTRWITARGLLHSSTRRPHSRRSARTMIPRWPPSWPRVNNCPAPEPDLSPHGPLVRHEREKIVSPRGRSSSMQYALLIYTKPGAIEALSPADREAVHQEYMALRQVPGMVGGASLHPIETATTVRVEDEQTLVTDGPFADTKEIFGGFYLVEAGNLDAATEIAARIPAARLGGSVEIRPVVMSMA